MNITTIDIWTTSSDYHSMTMAEDLVTTFESEFKDDWNVKFALNYVYYFCVFCSKNNFQSRMTDCICGGRYCFNSISDSNISGDDVVMENIR